jgi:hypothetical protein
MAIRNENMDKRNFIAFFLQILAGQLKSPQKQPLSNGLKKVTTVRRICYPIHQKAKDVTLCHHFSEQTCMHSSKMHW